MSNLIHGAKWWKFDFHNHTPASMDYGKGDEALKQITPKDWLLLYMAKEIDCVAVTDHNTGSWIDQLKIALSELERDKPEGYRPLYLFPGVEISANTNVHILALFDKDADSAKIAALLGSVGFDANHFGTSDAVTQKSVSEVFEAIIHAGGIAIPAHVDQPAGLFTVAAGHSLTQALKVEGLLAIELIDKTYAKPALYGQTKLNLTEIVGTDSHIPAQVGTNYTWIKMHSPCLESLKLALHDKEDGAIRKEDVAVDPNFINNRYFIKKIQIDKAYKAGNGQPLIAEFSPWLSSVIGGRGSGKSSIVNFLRIGMAKNTDMPEKIQLDFDDFNCVGKKNSPGMLRETTTIAIDLFKDGQLQQVLWNESEKKHYLKRWDLGEAKWSEPVEVSDIHELFPVQIFSQKELYALTDDPNKLIELIDSQFNKKDWIDKRDALIVKWLNGRSKKRQLANSVSDESNIRAQLDSTNNGISQYESSAFKETLNTYNTFSGVDKFFNNIDTKTSSLLESLSGLSSSFPPVEIAPEISGVLDDVSKKFVADFNDAIAAAKQKYDEALAILTPYKENLIDKFYTLPWKVKYDEAKSEYEGIIDKIKEISTQSYENLIQKRAILQEKLVLIERQKLELEEVSRQIESLYESIINLEKELRIKRKEIIQRWGSHDSVDSPFLTIDLHPMCDSRHANHSLRELIRRQGGEFADYIYNYNEDRDEHFGIIGEIINENEERRYEKRLDVIKKLIMASEGDRKGFDVRLIRHIDSLKTNTPEDIDRLLIWVPEDKLSLKFRKGDKLEDIQTGSAGERTAGMLGLLLALNDIPLIIDQPEDDLDTRLISSFVVPGFKKLKKNRQLILVTHNPNIAVNGNSDNVVYMNYHSGQIVVSGNSALQDREIRHAVCEVMEGGRDALNKRYYRISVALHQE